jgi:predicted transcriptional regulator
MTDATFTFRVDGNLKDQFAHAAKLKDRSSGQLLRDFMREFVQQQATIEHDRWFRNQIQTGIRQADAGEVLSSTEVEKNAEVWRKRIRSKTKGSKR